MSENQQLEKEHHSITGWFDGLKHGNVEAASRLWERYASALVAAARKHLGNSPKQVADEEDVLVSVFAALCRGATEGRFGEIRGRDDLWWLLLALTHRKAVSQLRRETAEKRGGWKQTLSLSPPESEDESHISYLALISDEPTPEFLMSLKEEHDALLGLLRNDLLRQVASLRLEGWSVKEVAERLGISTRAVERKLKLIRQTWSNALDL